LSYANVVSTLCLFLVLSGGAYAANRLTKNSVGPRELKRGAVGTANIANRAVTLPKLRQSAIRRLRGAKRPQGIQGPPGDPAAIGAGAVGTGNFAAGIPAARVTHSTEQIVESDLLTTLGFDEERYDTANLHAAGTNSRLTAPVAGVYLITANVEWSGEGASPAEAKGARAVALVRIQTIATQALLGAGDYVNVRVYHSQVEELFILSFSALPSSSRAQSSR